MAPDARSISTRHHVRWFAPVLAALTPALVTVMLVEVLFDKSLKEAIPYSDDEVAYYLQTAAFARAQFSAGYFTVNETPAAARFTRFGPHGPAFAALFGSIGSVAGWRPYSIVLTGLACVIVAAAFACWRLRLGLVTSILALGTFWPLIIAMPMSMQESLHFAFALFAAPFAWSVISGSSDARRARVWLVIVVAGATMVRPTWGLVLVPVAWIASHRNSLAIRALMVAAACLTTAAAYAFMMWMAAPFPRSQMAQLLPTRGDFFAPVGTLAARVASNLGSVFRDKAVAEAVWHAEAFVLLAVLAVFWIARRRAGAGPQGEVAAASAFGAILLLCLLSAIVLFYEFGSWRAFRVLASPMLLILFVGLAARASWARWIVIAHLLCTPVYLGAFQELHEPRFRADPTRITYLRRQVDPVLQFHPGASPWHNTVLVHVEAVEYSLVGLPPGIGMTVVLDWNELRRPPRSAYLLLRPKDREAIGSAIGLEPLAKTVFGTLYRNTDAPKLAAR
jgi:hypothetical protein